MSRKKCRIVSVEELNPFSPILVDFEFGFNSNFDSSGLKCNLYLDSQTAKEKSVIIERENKKFFGKVQSDELSQTLLLVRNKRTNEARIYSAQTCAVFDSAREEETLKRKRLVEKQEPEAKEDERRWKEHNLQMSFGSKKAKRAAGMNMKLNVNVSANAEHLEEAVSGINVSVDEVNVNKQEDADLMRLLPPHNRSAAKAEDVYSIESILTAEELEELLPAAEFVINNSLAKIDQKNNYFLYLHYNLFGSNPEPWAIAVLMYGASLIAFFNMKAHEMRGNDCLKKICPQSALIARKILNEFTLSLNNASNHVRSRPNYLKDKIICYVMVVVLLTCNLEVDIEKISSCIKGFGQKKLVQIARLVGLTPLRGAKKIHSLRLPLPPLPRNRKKKSST